MIDRGKPLVPSILRAQLLHLFEGLFTSSLRQENQTELEMDICRIRCNRKSAPHPGLRVLKSACPVLHKKAPIDHRIGIERAPAYDGIEELSCAVHVPKGVGESGGGEFRALSPSEGLRLVHIGFGTCPIPIVDRTQLGSSGVRVWTTRCSPDCGIRRALRGLARAAMIFPRLDTDKQLRSSNSLE